MLEVYFVIIDCLVKYKMKEMSLGNKQVYVNRNEIEKYQIFGVVNDRKSGFLLDFKFQIKD